MATEKCFCHLGDYKVKDADARKEITELKSKLDREVIDVYEEINFQAGVQTRKLNEVTERVTALENAGGSGGGSTSGGGSGVYQHNIKIYLQSEKIYQFVVYSSKSTPIKLTDLEGLTGVSVLITDGVDYYFQHGVILNISVEMGDFYGEMLELVTIETVCTNDSTDQSFISVYEDIVKEL